VALAKSAGELAKEGDLSLAELLESLALALRVDDLEPTARSAFCAALEALAAIDDAEQQRAVALLAMLTVALPDEGALMVFWAAHERHPGMVRGQVFDALKRAQNGPPGEA